MKIVFTGGGTAGHIMPSVALIERLKKENEIYYIGSKNGMEKEIIGRIKEVKYYEVSTVKFVRSLSLKNIAIPFKLLKGKREAKKILKEIQPDIVFSKGGFVSLPASLAAKCPLILHESDLTMGLANKLVKKKAAVICTSFKDTAEGLKNAVFTGSPIRQSLLVPKISSPKPVLLIMGGSLGASRINQLIAKCINSLIQHFDIIHLTGKGKKTGIINPHYTEMEFCDNIGSLYAKATIALSRGGGSALFELASLKIPSLIIPLPKGVSRGDQVDNAEYFKKLNLCKVLPEESLNENSLIESLTQLLRDKSIKESLENATNIDGTQKILDLILNYSNENKR